MTESDIDFDQNDHDHFDYVEEHGDRYLFHTLRFFIRKFGR